MAMCEDYPACGHTDGLPCDYESPNYHASRHLGCDHEAGDCYLNDVEPTCDTCGGEQYAVEMDGIGWCGSCGSCRDHCEQQDGCEVLAHA